MPSSEIIPIGVGMFGGTEGLVVGFVISVLDLVIKEFGQTLVIL